MTRRLLSEGQKNIQTLNKSKVRPASQVKLEEGGGGGRGGQEEGIKKWREGSKEGEYEWREGR